MLALSLPSGPLTVLCLGAHADDIEIGCGGTLLQLLEKRRRITVRWVVFSADEPRKKEARKSARRFLARAARARVDVLDFRDGFFSADLARLKEQFEKLKQPAPDLIFTHTRDDRHQDHRAIADLTWQTFRSHFVLEYEVPKYDGDLGSPNLFVPLAEPFRNAKVSHLLDGFPTQRDKGWFTAETFLGLMRLRGVESAAPEGYAEAFYARKARLAR